MRRILSILLILIVFSGCTQTKKSFDDPNIIAYIDNEPMYGLYGLNKENFIEMKTAMMEAVIILYSSVDFPSEDEIIGKQYNELISSAQEKYFYNSADYYLNSSAEYKEMDYYANLLSFSEDYIALSKEDDAEAVWEEIVNRSMMEAQNTEAESSFYKIILSIADKNGMTFDEVLEEYYKPYIPIMIGDEYIITNSFLEKKYKGEILTIVEDYYYGDINEDNYKEIYKHLVDLKNYLLDSRIQYIEYISKELSKSEIIERP